MTRDLVSMSLEFSNFKVWEKVRQLLKLLGEKFVLLRNMYLPI